ncbi:hypothetical protein ABK040_003293 [Willaertia magna]
MTESITKRNTPLSTSKKNKRKTKGLAKEFNGNKQFENNYFTFDCIPGGTPKHNQQQHKGIVKQHKMLFSDTPHNEQHRLSVGNDRYCEEKKEDDQKSTSPISSNVSTVSSGVDSAIGNNVGSNEELMFWFNLVDHNMSHHNNNNHETNDLGIEVINNDEQWEELFK